MRALSHTFIHVQNTHSTNTHTNVIWTCIWKTLFLFILLFLFYELEDLIFFFNLFIFSCDCDRIFSGSCFGEKNGIEVPESARSELDFKMSLIHISRALAWWMCCLCREEGVVEKEKGEFLQNLWSLLKPTYEVCTFAKYSKTHTCRYLSELLSWWRHRCFGRVEALHLFSYREYWKELKTLSQKQFESEFWLWFLP